MNPKNDSSQMKQILNPDLNSESSSKRTDQNIDQTQKKVNSKEAEGKGSTSKVENLKLDALKITNSEGAAGKGGDGSPQGGESSKVPNPQKVNSKAPDQKGSDQKGPKQKGPDNKKADQKEPDHKKADQKETAMGSTEGRPLGSKSSDSNTTASPGTSSNGAPPNSQSVKRKLSQTSYDEAAGWGSPPNTGEKLKREPECHMDPDKLEPNRDHTVLIDINESRDDRFVPYKGQPHAWDNLHVKLPTDFPKTGPKSRWDATVNALNSLKKKASIKDVAMAIMSYNQSYQREWKFHALETYVEQVNKRENNFSILIPKMAELAVRLPHVIQHAIPLLKQNRSHAITLSQGQISCLLANAFFCTFPHRNSTKPHSEYSNFPTINFSNLFGEPSPRKIEKLRALFHYFNTVTNEETRPRGLVTFERICIPPKELPNWQKKTEILTHLQVFSEGFIETEGKGLLQVDFAAKYVGGGVLGNGLVQEEIRFLMCPELIVARLFTEKLGDNECLKITGAQTYSVSSGYSDTFKWLGPYEDDTKRDKWKRRLCQIVAIDALNFHNPKDQYTKENIQRELNKAYVGFRPDPSVPLEYTPDIATGNWGCGAFKGDPELKALIQMMAAAVAGRSLAFFTFRNSAQARELRQIHKLLKTKRVSVGRLYTLLVRYCEEKQHYKSKSVFEFIQDKTGSASSHL
ncbi:poly(ADP-ribose) glycohydrolase [Astyanax mexicanus]|uniref:poly(ADP-ribose) glycohydrolase n=1 Tax=Astyanax mexicanus TaxID=7994 RepID=UPI0020CB5703|nr:poly(ADP-ribose) glycohydrolase [Astyanax mexicanus]